MFEILLGKMAVLYGVSFLGFGFGKATNTGLASLSKILVNLVVPVVLFFGIANAALRVSDLLLTLIVLGVCSTIALSVYALSHSHFDDADSAVLSFSAGTGNTGYFGIPVAVSLFPDALEIIALIVVGFQLFEITLGYYFLAAGSYTNRLALKKLVSTPLLWAFILGVITNFSGIELHQSLLEVMSAFVSVNTILGMLLLGIAVANSNSIIPQSKSFFCWCMGAKFLAWPIITVLLVLLDSRNFGAFSDTVYTVCILMSLCPVATNVVAFSAALEINTDNATSSLVFSSLVALFLIPTGITLSKALY